MVRIRVALNSTTPGVETDLIEWLNHQGIAAAAVRSAGQMGAPETVAITVAAAGALRGAFSVVHEWVRARRTEVEVSVDGGQSYKISSTTNAQDLVHLISSIQEGDHATAEKPGSVNDDV